MTEKSNPLAELVAWITLLDAWGYLAIITIAGLIVFAFWRMNRNRQSPFSLVDALEDPITAKTSYIKVIVFGSFIGAWVAIFWMLVHGADVVPIVTLVLGTFVAKSSVDRISDVFDPRTKAQALNAAPAMAMQPEPQPAGDITIKTEIK